MAEDLLVIPIFLAERIENLGKSFFKFLEQRFEKILLLNEMSENNAGEPTRNPDSQQPLWSQVIRVCMECCLEFCFCTVETRFTDTRLIRTPHYYGQFALSLGKVVKFSLNSTHFWNKVIYT